MSRELLTGRTIEFTDQNRNTQEGVVRLVYTDALASGENEYKEVTKVLITTKDGTSHAVNPRDLIKIKFFDKNEQ